MIRELCVCIRDVVNFIYLVIYYTSEAKYLTISTVYSTDTNGNVAASTSTNPLV